MADRRAREIDRAPYREALAPIPRLAGLATARLPGASSSVVTTAAKHGHTWATAILGSFGLHGLVYALLTTIEQPAPPARQTSLLMAYVLPIPRPAPEAAPPTAVEIEPADEPIREQSPAPVRPAPTESERQPDTQPEPQPEADSRNEANETETAEPNGQPSITRYEWYAAIPDAIARMRAAEAQAPHYRTFGAFVAPENEARRPGATARLTVGERLNALRAETTSWGEERAYINEHCYQSSYAPGSVLAEVHRFSNATINCEGGSAQEPRSDLFLDAKPAYLERHEAVLDLTPIPEQRLAE